MREKRSKRDQPDDGFWLRSVRVTGIRAIRYHGSTSNVMLASVADYDRPSQGVKSVGQLRRGRAPADSRICFRPRFICLV